MKFLKTNNLFLESGVRALDIADAIVSDGVDIHGVFNTGGSLNKARLIWASNEAQCTKSHFQFGAGANVELGVCFPATIQFNGHGNHGGGAGIGGVDVTQIVGVTILLLVEQVEPAVVAYERVVLQAFTNGVVLPTTASNDSRDDFRETAEPDKGQILLEAGHIRSSLACKPPRRR